MNARRRGVLIAVVQCLIVLSLTGEYEWERIRLPRAWVKAVAADPNLPLRGRYVSLRLIVDPPPGIGSQRWTPVRLSVRDGRLVAIFASTHTDMSISQLSDGSWALTEPVAFFIPDRGPEPSLPGQELWVEVSVPPSGIPRPIRLGPGQSKSVSGGN
jgi:hypothetical protein